MINHKRPSSRLPLRPRHAWDPALLTESEIASIKGMAALHQAGFKAIVEKICRLSEVSFAAGGEDGRRETDYAEGKRAVGIILRQIAAMELEPKISGSGPNAYPIGPEPAG